MDLYNKPSPQQYLMLYHKPSPQDCLTHHGILGQKWGNRNGPPYPLDASDHSASEKKAGWRKSLDKDGEKGDNKKQSKDIDLKQKGLTDKQKRAIKVGAALAATALIAYGGYKLKQSGKLDTLIEQGRQRAKQLLGDDAIGNQEFGSFWESIKKVTQQTDTDVFPPLSSNETIQEAVQKVNPSGALENCRACAIASVLRTLGMDVEALGSVRGGSLYEAVKDCFKKGKVEDIYSPNKGKVIAHILERFGEGSSGVLGATFERGYGTLGHAISWTIKDGAVLFFDGQRSISDCSNYLDDLFPDFPAEIARLDNLELKPRGIKKYIKGC